MTTTYTISLPSVTEAHVCYAGCGSHQLEITVQVQGEFDLDDFVEELVKTARRICHHRPTDNILGQPIQPLPHPVCRFCGGWIQMNGPDADGQQSWALT